MKPVEKLYFKSLQKLQEYCWYAMRCLYRCGIHPIPTDFVHLTVERNNGTIAEAVVYPKTAVKDDTVDNPMFFYGFKFDYDFHDLQHPIKVTYCKTIEELIE